MSLVLLGIGLMASAGLLELLFDRWRLSAFAWASFVLVLASIFIMGRAVVLFWRRGSSGY